MTTINTTYNSTCNTECGDDLFGSRGWCIFRHRAVVREPTPLARRMIELGVRDNKTSKKAVVPFRVPCIYILQSIQLFFVYRSLIRATSWIVHITPCTPVVVLLASSILVPFRAEIACDAMQPRVIGPSYDNCDTRISSLGNRLGTSQPHAPLLCTTV